MENPNLSDSPQSGIVEYAQLPGQATPAQYDPTAPIGTAPRPEMVPIGGEELPLDTVENLVYAGRNAIAIQREAEALLERNGTAANIATLMESMAPQTQDFIIQAIEYAKDCEAKGLPLTSVDEAVSQISPEFDGPEDFTRVHPTDMTDEAATVAEQVYAVHLWADKNFKKLANLVQALQNNVGSVVQQSQTLTAAQIASQKLGTEITPEIIREYAQGGVDLLKAINAGIITASNIGGGGEPTQRGNGQRPISAPPAGLDGKTIDPGENDARKVEQLYRAGYRYKDKALNDLLEESFSS